ncbi:hypothetical protein KUL72_30110 [Bradyrhizobium arachidis]|uniref:hypothetical protein n=1 Tax=Bradyrhizobium arachidis TaxID=858423 RepID=UPI0021612B26|nr:hypothetical protein [Bradyrhizobium arachidis]UVO35643.1 hypothetical protein KUL72_30110 [Bradyrhizobium arachidis]
MTAADWQNFLLRFQGDVDTILAAKAKAAVDSAASWKGKAPQAAVQPDGAFLADNADLKNTSLAVLEAEIDRLSKLVAADKLTADRLAAVTRRINEETVSA